MEDEIRNEIQHPRRSDLHPEQALSLDDAKVAGVKPSGVGSKTTRLKSRAKPRRAKNA